MRAQSSWILCWSTVEIHEGGWYWWFNLGPMCCFSFRGKILLFRSVLLKKRNVQKSISLTEVWQLSPIIRLEVFIFFFLFILPLLFSYEILIKELGNHGMEKISCISSFLWSSVVYCFSAWPCWSQANLSTEVSQNPLQDDSRRLQRRLQEASVGCSWNELKAVTR